MNYDDLTLFCESIRAKQLDTIYSVVIPTVNSTIKNYPELFGLNAEAITGHKGGFSRAEADAVDYTNYRVFGENRIPIIGTVIPEKSFWNLIAKRPPQPRSAVTGSIFVAQVYDFTLGDPKEHTNGIAAYSDGSSVTINLGRSRWWESELVKVEPPSRIELTSDYLGSQLNQACKKMKPLVATPL